MYGQGKAIELQVIQKKDGYYILYDVNTGHSYKKKMIRGEEEIEINTFVNVLDNSLEKIPTGY